MRVPPDPQAHAGEVLAIQRYARALGRDYLLCDVDQVGDLPAWDW